MDGENMPIQFKEERLACYSARDQFWNCLDLNNDEAEKCKHFRKEFENSCSKQWVNHFDRKRKYEKFKSFADANTWEFPPSNKGKKE